MKKITPDEFKEKYEALGKLELLTHSDTEFVFDGTSIFPLDTYNSRKMAYPPGVPYAEVCMTHLLREVPDLNAAIKNGTVRKIKKLSFKDDSPKTIITLIHQEMGSPEDSYPLKGFISHSELEALKKKIVIEDYLGEFNDELGGDYFRTSELLPKGGSVNTKSNIEDLAEEFSEFLNELIDIHGEE